MINLHELNVFVEAALAQNFSVAARRLYLSQPAVSLHIRQSREAAGDRIIPPQWAHDPAQRRGRVSAAHGARRAATWQAHRRNDVGPAGRDDRRISPSHAARLVGKYVLPRLVAGFRRCYPAGARTVNVTSRRSAIEWLLADRARARRSGRAAANHAEAGLRAVGARQHCPDRGRPIIPGPMAGSSPRGPVRRAVSSCARAPPGAYEVLAEGLASHGLDIEQLRTVLTLANAEAIEMSVEAGIGVAFVSRLAGRVVSR